MTNEQLEIIKLIVWRDEQKVMLSNKVFEALREVGFIPVQPAAPLSSLPDWQENAVNGAKKLGILGGPPLAAFMDGADWMFQHLQAENTRLREQLQAAQPPAAGEAVAWIAAERIRQVEKEGWTQEHDDEHTWGEMAIAAACYALHHTDASVKNPHTTNLNGWPWAEMWWKPSVDKIKNLVRAGALIAAEIDRISRQDAQTKGGSDESS